MAKVSKMPVNAPEAAQSDDLTLEQAKVVIGNLEQQNTALRGAIAALGNDCLALRDFCNKVLG